MNKSKNIKIIAGIVIVLIILAGMYIAGSVGFNFDLRYEKSKRIDVSIGHEFKIEDIRNITNEIFPNQRVILQKVELYEDMVAVTVSEASDEQLDALVSKINEKYEKELTKNDLNIVENPHVRLRDILKEYVVPFLIVSVVILVYMIIRYRKIGIIKVIISFLESIFLSQALYFSIISITRLPITELMVPVSMFIYVIVMILLTIWYEKRLGEKVVEENANKKNKK